MQQIGELTEKLAPVTEDHVAKGIRSLLAAGLALPSGMQADRAPEIFAYALSGSPAFGVQKAVSKIIRGEYDINRGFVPTPPELAAMARAEARILREDKLRLMDKLETIEVTQRQPEPRNEAMLARIHALRERARKIHAEHRVGAEAFPEPLSAESAEYYQKIMALRDAPRVTAEQAAMRRKVQRDLQGSMDTENAS